MNPHAQALGKLGGKAGRGKAKARASEQARAAVNARWEKYHKRKKQGEKIKGEMEESK